MKPMTMLCGLAIALIATGTVLAQETPPPTAPPAMETLTPATETPGAGAPAAGWTPLSRSSQKVYLIDPAAVRRADGVVTVQVARVSIQRDAPDDFGYGVDEIELRCDQDQSRATVSIEYGPDGAEIDRYEDPSAWDTIRPNTLDASAQAIACENATLSARGWPTIQAYVEAGLP